MSLFQLYPYGSPYVRQLSNSQNYQKTMSQSQQRSMSNNNYQKRNVTISEVPRDAPSRQLDLDESQKLLLQQVFSTLQSELTQLYEQYGSLNPVSETFTFQHQNFTLSANLTITPSKLPKPKQNLTHSQSQKVMKNSRSQILETQEELDNIEELKINGAFPLENKLPIPNPDTQKFKTLAKNNPQKLFDLQKLYNRITDLLHQEQEMEKTRIDVLTEAEQKANPSLQKRIREQTQTYRDEARQQISQLTVQYKQQYDSLYQTNLVENSMKQQMQQAQKSSKSSNSQKASTVNGQNSGGTGANQSSSACLIF